MVVVLHGHPPSHQHLSHNMARFVLAGAVCGCLVAVVILVVTRLQGGMFHWPYLAIALWPTSYVLMGVRQMNLFGMTIFALAVLVNVAVYAAAAAILWWVSRKFFANP
jgi:hypothetical protein